MGVSKKHPVELGYFKVKLAFDIWPSDEGHKKSNDI